MFSAMAPNNYTGGVDISCSGTIPQGNCSVQPPSITVNGSSAVGFQVTVASTAATGAFAAPTYSQTRSRPMPVLALLVFLLFAALFMTTFFERSAAQRARCRLTLGLLLAGTLLLGSCGGGSKAGSGPGGGNPGTPQGSYVFTVTASAGGGTRTLQITAVVQ